jgi:hypothetical protein
MRGDVDFHFHPYNFCSTAEKYIPTKSKSSNPERDCRMVWLKDGYVENVYSRIHYFSSYDCDTAFSIKIHFMYVLSVGDRGDQRIFSNYIFK